MWAITGAGITWGNELRAQILAHLWISWALPGTVWLFISLLRLFLDALCVVAPIAPSMPVLLSMVVGNAFLTIPLFQWPSVPGPLLFATALHASIYVQCLTSYAVHVLGLPVGMVLGMMNVPLLGWIAIRILVNMHPASWPELRLHMYNLYAVVLPWITLPQVLLMVIVVGVAPFPV